MAIWILPEDKDPTVLQYPTRKGISVFGAVNFRTGEFIGMMSVRFNVVTFKKFLMVLIKRGKGEEDADHPWQPKVSPCKTAPSMAGRTQ